MSETKRKKGWVERGTSIFGERAHSSIAEGLFPQKYDGITHELVEKLKELTYLATGIDKESLGLLRREIPPALGNASIYLAISVFVNTISLRELIARQLIIGRNTTKGVIDTLPEILGGVKVDSTMIEAEKRLQELREVGNSAEEVN